jgi:PST family polysaccharide transporter
VPGYPEIMCDIDYFSNDKSVVNIKKSVSHGARLTILTKFIDYIVATICTVILARLLTPDDFGLVTIVMTVGLLLRNFGVNGFSEAIIQEDRLNHEKLNSLFWVHLCFNSILAILFLLSTPLIIWFYNEGRIKPIIYAMSVTIILPCFSTPNISLLKRNLLYSKFSLISLLQNIISSLLGVILGFAGAGYWAIVVRRSSIPLLGAIGGWIWCSWRPSKPHFSKSISHMVKFGVHTYGNFAMTYLRKNIDTILVAKYFGSDQLANYDRAYHLFLMPLNQLGTPLKSVALPLLSKLRDDPAKFLRYYSKSISIFAFIGMLISSVITVIGKDFVVLLLGPKWHVAGDVLTFFGPAIGCMLLYQSIPWVHLALGNADRLFKWGILSVVIFMISIIIGLKFGTLGVAAGTTLSFYLLLVPGLWYALRPLKYSIIGAVIVIFKQILSASISIGICFYIKTEWLLLSGFLNNLNIIIRIILISIVCILIFVSSNICIHQGLGPIRETFNFLMDMIPDRLKKKHNWRLHDNK